MALLSANTFSGSVNVVISGSPMLNVENGRGERRLLCVWHDRWEVVAVIGIAFVQQLSCESPFSGTKKVEEGV